MANENTDSDFYQKWAKKYYKIGANELVKGYILKKNIKQRLYISKSIFNAPSFTRLERILVLHSLKKWMGIRTGILKAHQISIYKTKLCFQNENNRVTQILVVDSSSCALCQFYLTDETGNDSLDSNEIDCKHCPLSKALGGKTCDDTDMPFEIFWDHSNPEPIIKALWKAAKAVRLAEQAERKSKK